MRQDEFWEWEKNSTDDVRHHRKEGSRVSTTKRIVMILCFTHQTLEAC